MISGPNSPNFNPLDCQVWGNAGVLTKAATEAKSSSWVLKCTLVNLVCVTGEDNWQRCERLPQATTDVCVSQQWTFWAFNVMRALISVGTCCISLYHCIYCISLSVCTSVSHYCPRQTSRVNCRKYFFAVRVINEWNSLPNDIVLISHLSLFKNRLKQVDLSQFVSASYHCFMVFLQRRTYFCVLCKFICVLVVTCKWAASPSWTMQIEHIVYFIICMYILIAQFAEINK